MLKKMFLFQALAVAVSYVVINKVIKKSKEKKAVDLSNFVNLNFNEILPEIQPEIKSDFQISLEDNTKIVSPGSFQFAKTNDFFN